MKMFNHLKHLTLNKVYLKYFGIPQESFEVAQNPQQTRDKSGKQVWRKTYPFFRFWPFWHPKRVTRVTRHYRQKVPFLRVFLVARVYSHIVEWPPPPPGNFYCRIFRWVNVCPPIAFILVHTVMQNAIESRVQLNTNLILRLGSLSPLWSLTRDVK